jgi:urea transport system substrate-binding protein
VDGDPQGHPPNPDQAGGGPSPGAAAKPEPADESAEFMRTVIGQARPAEARDPAAALAGDSSGGGVKVAPVGGAAESLVGQRVGNHLISSVIGRGGMGVVYEATDSVLSRKVAIKMLPETLVDDPTATARFLQEARAVAQLNHPNVVSIYEIGRHDSGQYLVLELVSGLSMAQAVQSGPLHWREATEVVAQACRGLAAAHGSGLLHRDIKPANLLRGSDGVVKITDFGLAKSLQGMDKTLTRAGHVVGTPCFMSPEQCQSNPLDARSDVYSLGATYFALLTGMGPYENSETASSILFAHCFKPVPDPRDFNHAVPKPVAAVACRAMAKEPAERYPSAEAFLADLEALLAGKPPSALGKTYSPPPDPTGLRGLGLSPDATSQRRRPTRRLVIASLAGTAAVAATSGLAYWSWKNREDSRGEAAEAGSKISGETAPGVIAPRGEPIRVGILHSQSGDMAESEEGPIQGTVLALEELNEQGGLLGRPLKYELADGMSNPARFAEQARILITERKVCTIFGCWTSACRKMVKPVVEELGGLLVYPIQYEGIEESPNIIYIGTTANQQIIPSIQWLAPRYGRRFVHIGSDYVFPRVAGAIIRDQVKQVGGELTREAFVPLASFAVGPLIEAVMEGKPDVILNSINGTTNLAFFPELRRAGVAPDQVPTCSFSLAEAQVQAIGPEVMKGNYAAWSYFMSIDRPENESFVKRFQKKYGIQKRTSDPVESAYFGVHLWAKGVAQAGRDEPRAIREAMLGQELNAPEGRVRIVEKNGHTARISRIGEIQDDGLFKIVGSSETEVLPEPFPSTRSRSEWDALLEELKRQWDGRWEA